MGMLKLIEKEVPMNALSLYRPRSIQKALEDFDRLFDSFFGDFGDSNGKGVLSTRIPAVDVRETEDAYILEAELPGFDEKSISAHVDGKVLTIETKRDEKTEKREGTYVLQERYCQAFKRSFTLPEDANPDAITASFKNGLLTMTIKKQPEAQRKLIKIEG